MIEHLELNLRTAILILNFKVQHRICRQTHIVLFYHLCNPHRVMFDATIPEFPILALKYLSFAWFQHFKCCRKNEKMILDKLRHNFVVSKRPQRGNCRKFLHDPPSSGCLEFQRLRTKAEPGKSPWEIGDFFGVMGRKKEAEQMVFPRIFLLLLMNFIDDFYSIFPGVPLFLSCVWGLLLVLQ